MSLLWRTLIDGAFVDFRVCDCCGTGWSDQEQRITMIKIIVQNASCLVIVNAVQLDLPQVLQGENDQRLL